MSIVPQDPDSNKTPPPEHDCSEFCGHDSWAGLMRLLDEHWPDDIFPTRYEDDPKRDAGPRIVSLMRWIDQVQAKVARVEAVVAELDRKGDDLWTAYKTASPSDPRRANPLVEGQVDAFDEAYELVRRALAGDV